MAEIIETDRNDISEIQKDAIALRTRVQSLDKKIKDMKELKNTNEATELKNINNVAVNIEALQSGQEDLQSRVDELLNELSVMGDSTHDEVKVLKTSLNGFKREERSLQFHYGILAKKFKKPNSRNNLEAEDCKGEESEEEEEIAVSRTAMLSKKLKIMTFYYHYLFVLSSADEEFSTNILGLKEQLGFLSRNVKSIFKRGGEEKYLNTMGYSDSNLKVENFEDLKGKIPELMLKRGEEIEKQRKDGGKKSFVERLKELCGEDLDGDDDSSFEGIWKSSLDEINGMAIQVGILLSRRCSDFLFAVSENEDAIRQYQKSFKCLVKFLIDDKEELSGIVIKKVLSVLKFAEGQLVKMGKLRKQTLDDHDQETAKDNDDDREVISLPEVEIDRVLGMLLREVTCLESVLSYPTLSGLQVGNKLLLKWQLSALKEALGEGKKEMEMIGLKVDFLKNVQCGLTEDDTDVMMTKFRKVMDANIIETWHHLNLDQSGLFSSMLKILKFHLHYMFAQDVRGGENLLKRHAEESILIDMGYLDSDFRVKNFKDFTEKIRGLIYEKKRKVFDSNEQFEGKKSYMEVLKELRKRHDDADDESSFERIWKSSLDEIKGMAIQVGILLSLCCSDFLFVVSKNENAVRRYQKCFKWVVKLLIDDNEEWSGVVIKNIISMLEFAERELLKLGVLKEEMIDDHDQRIADGDGDWKVFSSGQLKTDHVSQILLREVLSLVSLLSYPSLSDEQTEHELSLQICYLKAALGECKKELEKLRQILYNMQVNNILNQGIYMETLNEFRQSTSVKIKETWDQVEQFNLPVQDRPEMNGPQQWNCFPSVCNVSFESIDGLKNHRRALHRKSKKRCEECHYKMQHDTDYETHMCP